MSRERMLAYLDRLYGMTKNIENKRLKSLAGSCIFTTFVAGIRGSCALVIANILSINDLTARWPLVLEVCLPARKAADSRLREIFQLTISIIKPK